MGEDVGKVGLRAECDGRAWEMDEGMGIGLRRGETVVASSSAAVELASAPAGFEMASRESKTDPERNVMGSSAKPWGGVARAREEQAERRSGREKEQQPHL